MVRDSSRRGSVFRTGLRRSRWMTTTVTLGSSTATVLARAVVGDQRVAHAGVVLEGPLVVVVAPDVHPVAGRAPAAHEPAGVEQPLDEVREVERLPGLDPLKHRRGEA